MKATIQMTRTIHQHKNIEIDLTEEQISSLCEEHEIEPEQITYEMAHYILVDCGNGEALAQDENGWVNSKLEQDKKDWDGCCDELIHDDGTVSKYDYKKHFLGS